MTRTSNFRALVLLGLAVIVGGCGGFTAEVVGKEPFAPPAVYAEWWVSTEDCANRAASLGRVEWYLAASVTGDHQVARGRWSPPHEIIIVRGYEMDELTVRHEMLHDLLGGDRKHVSPQWLSCDLIPD